MCRLCASVEPEMPPPMTRQSTVLAAWRELAEIIFGVLVMDWCGGANAIVVASVIRSSRRGNGGRDGDAMVDDLTQSEMECNDESKNEDRDLEVVMLDRIHVEGTHNNPTKTTTIQTQTPKHRTSTLVLLAHKMMPIIRCRYEGLIHEM